MTRYHILRSSIYSPRFADAILPFISMQITVVAVEAAAFKACYTLYEGAPGRALLNMIFTSPTLAQLNLSRLLSPTRAAVVLPLLYVCSM